MRKRRRHPITLPIVFLAGVLAGLAGCRESEPPPVAYVGPMLARADLGVKGIECDATGFVILEKQASCGRFPGALAVARLEPPDPPAATHGASPDCWYVGTMKEEEAVYLNMLFNNVTGVREVIVLDQPAFVRPQAELAQIAAVARRVGAGLCLVFGPAPAGPEHAALAGVILDAKTQEPVALVQAQSGPADFELPRNDAPERDQRHRDPNYIVARKFDRQLRRCVLELMAKDQPLPTTMPSPWRYATTRPAPQRVYIMPNRPARW